MEEPVSSTGWLAFLVRAIPAIAAASLTGVGALHAAPREPDVLRLQMEHFRDTATVQENSATGTVISTEPGYVRHSGLMRMIWSDEFLRAVIDRASGRKSFEVIAWVIYNGKLRAYDKVRYPGRSGETSLPTTVISRESSECAVGDCNYTERVAFAVDEGLLCSLAAGAAASQPVLWPYTLVATRGPDAAGSLSTAEIAGLLAKVDAYVANPPPLEAAAVAPRQFDFGIAGINVDGADEVPPRPGILVTRVKRGSVAAGAGLMVGDIVHDFGGHATASLPDLRSAEATCVSRSHIAIKVYRGTADTTLMAACP
jgi:hypothetical protein